MEKIKLQNQPCDKSCTSACLAMILDLPVEDVVKEFHDGFLFGTQRPASYLRQKRIRAREFSGIEQQMWSGFIYLLAVPSINTEATMHSVLLDCRDSCEIFDPRRDGVHRYYTYENSDDPLSVKLKGFIIDCEILSLQRF